MVRPAEDCGISSTARSCIAPLSIFGSTSVSINRLIKVDLPVRTGPTTPTLCALGNVVVNASFFHFDVPPQTLGISSLHLVSTVSLVSLFSAVMASEVVL